MTAVIVGNNIFDTVDTKYLNKQKVNITIFWLCYCSTNNNSSNSKLRCGFDQL